MSPDRCPWYIAGPLLGLVIVGLRVALNKPFGALGGYIELAGNATRPRQLGFRGFLLLGFVAGGALFALAFDRLEASFVYGTAGGLLPAEPSTQLLPLLLAGAAMGFGARHAGGCTSGHGLSGMSLGSSASIAASMTFFGTAVVLAHVLLRLAGGAP